MPTRPNTRLLAILLTTLALLIGAVAPAVARHDDDTARPGGQGNRGALAVYHGPVEVTLVNAESDGHQLGDLRVTSFPTTNEDGEPLGRLDATLTTTAVDVPGPGDEIRISELVFSFGEGGSSQIVVGGTAVYPGEGSTIEVGDTTTRAILGGSGRFGGATGSVVTQHLEDGSWVHTIRVDRRNRLGGAIGRLFKGPVKAEAKERRAELKALRAERRAVRKADRDADRTARREREHETSIELDPGTETTVSASAEVGITRTDLGVAEPGSAPGEELGLWRYAIPAGSDLAPHTHPGWQIARIASGELEYTIISGEGTLIHADGSSEPIGPGSHILETGDSVVENPDLEHFGANRTDEEVTILAATLFPAGAAMSTPLDVATE